MNRTWKCKHQYSATDDLVNINLILTNFSFPDTNILEHLEQTFLWTQWTTFSCLHLELKLTSDLRGVHCSDLSRTWYRNQPLNIYFTSAEINKWGQTRKRLALPNLHFMFRNVIRLHGSSWVYFSSSLISVYETACVYLISVLSSIHRNFLIK